MSNRRGQASPRTIASASPTARAIAPGSMLMLIGGGGGTAPWSAPGRGQPDLDRAQVDVGLEQVADEGAPQVVRREAHDRCALGAAAGQLEQRLC
jgi:hypothetical protein